MTGLADVYRFKWYIQECVQPCIIPMYTISYNHCLSTLRAAIHIYYVINEEVSGLTISLMHCQEQ